ncbi:MAG: hypothetical protein P4M01_04720 [Acidobacteriota bacterium]|nr:hypothetical protein [Acidobacteriota bacterium]
MFLLLAPWQLEYREGAVLFQVKGLLAGVPVYSPGQLPVYLNVYGTVYNSLAAILGQVFGVSFFLLRAISFVSIALSLVVFNDILRRRGAAALIRLALCFYLYLALLYATTPLARPDAMGFLVMLLCFWCYVVWPESLWSMLAITMLSLMGLLIKQYFAMAGPLLISHTFFFRSHRRGVAWAAFFFCALAAAWTVHGYFYPGYLPLALASTSGKASPLDLHSTLYMLKQSTHFLRLFLGAVLLCWVYSDRSPQIWRQRLRLSCWPVYCACLMLLLLEGKLGHHDGAYLTYYLQLLAPFLLLAVAPSANENVRPMRFAAAVLAVVLLLTAAQTWKTVRSPFLTARAGREFAAAAEDLSARHSVLGSPILVGILLAQNKPVYYSGQSMDLIAVANKKALHLPGLKPSPEQCAAIDAAYQAKILNMIMARQFDLVVTDDDDSLAPRQKEAIRAYYTLARVRNINGVAENEWEAKDAAIDRNPQETR